MENELEIRASSLKIFERELRSVDKIYWGYKSQRRKGRHRTGREFYPFYTKGNVNYKCRT